MGRATGRRLALREPLRTGKELPQVVRALSLDDLHFWRGRCQHMGHELRVIEAEIERRDPQGLWELPLFRGLVEKTNG